MKTFVIKTVVAVIIACFVLTANTGLAKAWQMKILVFGDSLAAGYGVEENQSYPAVLKNSLLEKKYDVEVLNHGVSGDTTAGGLNRIDWALSEKPDLVILELGANDMLRAISPEVTKNNLDKILHTIINKNKLPVLLVGMKAPINLGAFYTGEYNSIYKSLASKYEVELYPFFLEGVWDNRMMMQEDGLHPNAEGIKKMVQNTLPYVEKLIERKK